MACADADPPTFAAEAALAVDTDADRVAFEWPAASDDRSVTAYLVRIDGQPAARLGPEARSYAADELAEASAHRVEVVAIDEAGNESSALTATATTPDGTAPAFADGSQPTLTAEGAEGDERRAVTLSWPEAADAVGVTGYRVLRGDEEVATTQDTSIRLEDVPLTDATRFAVRALDAADNESTEIETGWAGAAQRRTEQEQSAARRRVEESQARVEQMLLGALGGGGGGLASVLRGGDLTGGSMSGVDEVMANAEGVGVATAGGLRGGSGGGGRVGGLGELRAGSASGGLGGLGGLSGTAPRPRGTAVLSVRGGTDEARDALERLVRMRRGALLRCYERQLASEPQLAGRVEVALSISEEGRVTSASITEDSLGRPGVSSCVRTILRSTRASDLSAGSYPVLVVFSPAS